jgi:RimJ/RimL family protein N-acetyltransferase
MEVTAFKLKHTRDILSWIKTEVDMVQWAGPVFSWPMTQKQFISHIKAGKAAPPTLYPFVLLHQNSVVGYCKLSNHNRNSNSATLSRVAVSPNHRNHGMATFMISNVINFGFNNLCLNRISLSVFDFNEAAIRCYEKIGFCLEGTLRKSAKAVDSYWNCHMMSILRSEWIC